SRYTHRVCDPHYIQPLLGVAVSSALAPDLVDQYLSPSAWYRVQSRRPQFAQDSLDSQAGYLSQVINFRRRKTVQVDAVSLFQLAQQARVVVEGQVRVQAPLHQDAAAAKVDHLLNFLEDAFIVVHITFRGAWLTVESTKVAD